ncbi:MAG: NAD-dependent epimerase/dehydratase family protein [Proteobacteria bacterium]|nr:NAD-dependent epimerase/dehydratase family protein [Pseudomonadota bacterium]MBU1686561.1 NAD-dependent epimerase/dehydratase family protein [Pseudomonadota bacterium]
MSRQVLITGAGGFIGRRLSHRLERQGIRVRSLVRQGDHGLIPGNLGEVRITGRLNETTDWAEHLEGCDAVVHLAARIPKKRPGESDEFSSYWQDNVILTSALTHAAIRSGVKRLVFLSSIKAREVEDISPVSPPVAGQVVSAGDCYAITKAAAEAEIRSICSGSMLEYVVIRPPLVFGPGVGGNFALLIRLVASGLPLPFAGINNRRSYIYLDNLVDFIIRCLDHPAAAGEIFPLADAQDLSTPELIIEIARALKVRPRLFTLPLPVLHLAGRLTGMGEQLERLCGSSRIESIEAIRKLDWCQSVSLEQGIARTVIGDGETGGESHG